jgi:prepilin-type N-terminal cleavage/methylation domain-containing protein
VPRQASNAAGFSLAELMLVVAVFATIMAMALPATTNMLDSAQLTAVAREMERELQTARLKAVSANRVMRVQFNCPAMGQFRMIEMTGTASIDTATNRCDPVLYPFPGAVDAARGTRRQDGPVRHLDSNSSISGTAILEFRPDGTARVVVSGVSQPILDETTVTVTRKSRSRSVGVNARGRVHLIS